MKHLKSRKVALILALAIFVFMIGYTISSDAAKYKIIRLPFRKIVRMLSKIEAKLDSMEPGSGEATDLTEVNGKLDAIEAKLDIEPEEGESVDLSGIEERLDNIESVMINMQGLLEEIMDSLPEPEIEFDG